MGGRRAGRTHLVEHNRDTEAGERACGLAAREAATDDERRQVATDSAGAASVSGTSCPHFRHLR